MISFLKRKHLTRNTKQLPKTNDLFISLVSLSYVLAFMEYWPHVDCKYMSNFTHHCITNLKVLTIFHDSCVCGHFCDCGLNCETATRRNATASIVETMCYFNRKIGLPDLGIASFRAATNLHSFLTLSCGTHTVVHESSFSKPAALIQCFLIFNVGQVKLEQQKHQLHAVDIGMQPDPRETHYPRSQVGSKRCCSC